MVATAQFNVINSLSISIPDGSLHVIVLGAVPQEITINCVPSVAAVALYRVTLAHMPVSANGPATIEVNVIGLVLLELL
jgi:hypothetical protein